MALEKDFLTLLQDAIILLMKDDAILKEYRWQEWDSDTDVQLPRASMSVSAEGELGYGDIWTVRPELTLEGKPKKQKLSVAMYRMERTVTAANLHTLLEDRADGKLKFYGRAEKFSVRQVVEGDVRRRTISFDIALSVISD